MFKISLIKIFQFICVLNDLPYDNMLISDEGWTTSPVIQQNSKRFEPVYNMIKAKVELCKYMSVSKRTKYYSVSCNKFYLSLTIDFTKYFCTLGPMSN